MTQFEAEVPSEPAAIADCTERVMDFLKDAGVDARATHHVVLVLEELLTNIATHGGAPAKAARIRVAIEPKRVAGEILDSGSPYDPRQGPRLDIGAKLEDRQIGGLGLHLVTQVTSELDYGREGDRNLTVFAIARAT